MPNIAWQDPNLKFIDLTGDGHADVLISEDNIFTWYGSLAEAGFGPAQRVNQALEEEQWPTPGISPTAPNRFISPT